MTGHDEIMIVVIFIFMIIVVLFIAPIPFIYSAEVLCDAGIGIATFSMMATLTFLSMTT